MLTAEAAAQRLEPWLLPSWEDVRNLPPVFNEIAKLPSELRAMGYAVFQRDGDGKIDSNTDWQERHRAHSSAISNGKSPVNLKYYQLVSGVLIGCCTCIGRKVWKIFCWMPPRRAWRWCRNVVMTIWSTWRNPASGRRDIDTKRDSWIGGTNTARGNGIRRWTMRCCTKRKRRHDFNAAGVWSVS